MMPDREPGFCGYCLGRAVWVQGALRWEHADAGERVRVCGPGDFVSARHNQAGTQVLSADLVGACGRCRSAPIDDEDSGLCSSCTDYNAGRVVL